jgi:phenylacetate-CoA ligase
MRAEQHPVESSRGRKGQLIKFKGTSLYPPALYDVLDNIPQVKDYIIDVYTNDLGTDEIVVRVAPTIQFASPEYIAKIKYPETSRKAIKFVDLR